MAFEKIKKYYYPSLAFLAVFFIAATSLLSWSNLRQPKFDAPDETMNYFFAARVARSLPLPAHDPDIAVTKNLLHPRSFNVISSALVPGGFLGFPVLAGLFGRIFGVSSVLFLTPLLAAAGVFSLASLTARVFNRRTAWLVALLAFTNPALLYHTSTAMFPNVAFVSLLLLGVAFMVSSRRSSAIVGGLCVGLALFVRASEAALVAVGVLGTLIAFVRARRPRDVMLLLAGLFIGLLPMFFLNDRIYGSPFSTGYARFADTAGEIATLPLEFSSASVPKTLILPFGFHPATIARNVAKSFFLVSWWVSVPMLAGAALWFTRRRPKAERWYLGALTLTAVWLFAFYGSWLVGTPLIRAAHTIGLSYVRYWLPLTLLSLPFVAIFYQWLFRQSRAAAVVVFVLTSVMSIHLVFFGTAESVLPTRERLRAYRQAVTAIADLTEERAVIITVRTDKIVYPERRVIAAWPPFGTDLKLLALLPSLARDFPLYLYARFDHGEEGEATDAFARVGFRLAEFAEIRAGERLYRVVQSL